MKIATSLKRCHPTFSQQPPSEGWRPVKLPLFENLIGKSTPSAEGGVHTMTIKNDIEFKT